MKISRVDLPPFGDTAPRALGHPVAGPGASGATLRAWPRRRWIAGAVPLPIMLALFASTSGAITSAGTAWWTRPGGAGISAGTGGSW